MRLVVVVQLLRHYSVEVVEYRVQMRYQQQLKELLLVAVAAAFRPRRLTTEKKRSLLSWELYNNFS
jgi:hypothetical protein